MRTWEARRALKKLELRSAVCGVVSRFFCALPFPARASWHAHSVNPLFNGLVQ